MKIGICQRNSQPLLEYSPVADFVELSASRIAACEQEEYEELLRAVRDGRVSTYSCNVLIKSDLRLTGPEVDFEAIRAYCDKLFYRLAELKIELLVFGSGKAKHVPEGFPMEKAWDQLFEIGHILSENAKPYGQTIVVEPLSYADVNIINTVDEAVYYAKQVNQDNFKAMIDFYHADNNKDPLSTLEKNKEWIAHAHFASQETRMPPINDKEWSFFTQCVTELKKIGYMGALSYEGRYRETDDPDAMLRRMKEITESL